jgi:hypothetical protein
MNTIKQFHIYHCTGDDKFTEVEVQTREYVGYVECHDLESAFALSQNVIENWNPLNPSRSTSIGDVIVADDGAYMVLGQGFRLLDDLSNLKP